MQEITTTLQHLSGFIWGQYALILLLGTGIYLSIGLRLLPWRKIGLAFKQLFSRSDKTEDGQISSFQALMTALSATIGTGNIVGVAAAILIGGPGAIFWMWMTALFGMATKYGEAVLAVKYREIDSAGNYVGGPMYYIKNGLGSNWAWLAYAFALFGMLASFGIGNMFQSNAVAGALSSEFSVAPAISGMVMAVLAGAVIIGGIKRLGAVAGKLVPFMAVTYIAGSITILVMHYTQIPDAFHLIIYSAFNGAAATGGFAGAAIIVAIQQGVARGIFSNEAGLGSAPIAHAAARTNDPVKQGLVGMLGTFIDTLIVCTMTALVIIISGAWTHINDKTILSAAAYGQALPGAEYVITFGIIIFAFTTILGWSYYGERCAQFIFGRHAITPYRLLWVIAIYLGATQQFDLVILFSDVMNGFMALPNLIALLLLSPVIFKISRDYFRTK